MKKYKFLLKPIFFVFNLFFATWLVITIERIQPSDFGRNSNLFDRTPLPKTVSAKDKPYLIDLINKYKNGLIDSNELNAHLDAFLAPPEDKPVKK
jgi:hypothetical protein